MPLYFLCKFNPANALFPVSCRNYDCFYLISIAGIIIIKYFRIFFYCSLKTLKESGSKLIENCNNDNHWRRNIWYNRLPAGRTMKDRLAALKAVSIIQILYLILYSKISIRNCCSILYILSEKVWFCNPAKYIANRCFIKWEQILVV